MSSPRGRATDGLISRRRAIALGAGAASLAAGGVLWQRASGADHLIPADLEAPLSQPPVLDSRDGRLELTLVAAPGVRLAGRDTRAYGYNGRSPGPTLRVRPGDELSIRLINGLTQPTNLHTHGLRVSPADSGDNPFVQIEPGAAFAYRIRIPHDHPAGTHWYHPHQHGTGADQIFGGLAGALLVVPRGHPHDINVSVDHVLVLTDTTLDADGRLIGASASARVVGREGGLLLVNGQVRPTIAAEPGRWQRWRLVNACTSRVLDVEVPDHPLTQVAVDGSLLPVAAVRDRVRICPGGRADVLIRPRGSGRIPVLARGVDRGSFGTNRASTASSTLAVLDLDEAGTADEPQPAVPTVPQPRLAEVTRRRVLTLTMARGTDGMAFGIDDKTHDPDRLDLRVIAGTTEEWLLNNAGPLAHPFHLHVWPFSVLETSDGQPPSGVLQDVVLVPARGWARITIPFLSQVGRSVYHCHIVDHSEAGMMGTILVA